MRTCIESPSLIKKVSQGRTTLMVEHNMNLVAGISDRITVLQRGAVLAEGTYDEVSKDPQVMEAYMGTTAALRAHDATPALEVAGLQAWYGESHILHGVDFFVEPGEVVTLLGRNGAGRTTTLRAILGLTDIRKGSVKIDGRETIDMPTSRSRTWVSATALKNAGFSHPFRRRRTCYCRPSSPRPARACRSNEIYDLFPNLKERR